MPATATLPAPDDPPDNPPDDGSEDGDASSGGGGGGGQKKDGGRHGRDEGRPDLTALAGSSEITGQDASMISAPAN